jgi:alanine racemase
MHEPVIDGDEVRPTHIEVDLDAIAENYDTVRTWVGRPVMPILKANAYGHGLVPVARKLAAAGAPVFGVAYLEEAVQIRKAGITTRLLVLGGILGDQIPRYVDHDLELTASSVDKLDAIQAHAAARGVSARVHLKIDTGLQRIGVRWTTAPRLLEAALRCTHVDVVGVFSHLATADDPETPAREGVRLQRERFEEVLRWYDARSLPRPVAHLANSGAVLQHPDTWLDLVRPGILLYGVLPDDRLVAPFALRPALTWRTRVVYFKVVLAGQPVSYGWTWAPTRDTRVITLPVGYGDGYPRALSNCGDVLVRGQRCPTVGRVCMDQTMADLGTGTAYNGDDVVLVGQQGTERIRIEDLARQAGTVPHEILTSINTRVSRVYVGGP